jgi:hypothetical protein
VIQMFRSTSTLVCTCKSPRTSLLLQFRTWPSTEIQSWSCANHVTSIKRPSSVCLYLAEAFHTAHPLRSEYIREAYGLLELMTWKRRSLRERPELRVIENSVARKAQSSRRTGTIVLSLQSLHRVQILVRFVIGLIFWLILNVMGATID